MSRANTDLKAVEATATRSSGRGVVGLNGDFSVLERNFNWEIAANYGYSRNTSSVPAYVFQNLQNALDATLDASGNIVCAGNPVAAAGIDRLEHLRALEHFRAGIAQRGGEGLHHSRCAWPNRSTLNAT